MAKPLPPIPMPSFRELFVGMLLLTIVGGFAITRESRPVRLAPVDTSSITAGLLNDQDEIDHQLSGATMNDTGSDSKQKANSAIVSAAVHALKQF